MSLTCNQKQLIRDKKMTESKIVKTNTTAKKTVKPTTQREAELIKVVSSEEEQDLSINLYGGKTTFFPKSVEIAKDVHQCLTTQQAIKIAGLDWPVLETELYYNQSYRDSNGEIQQRSVMVPNYKMVYKSNPSGDDDIFQLSSDSWTPVQNSTAFEFFDPILSDGKAKLDTAVMLDKGRKIVITAKIEGLSSDITKGDQIDSYLVLHNGHDGKTSLGVMFTPIRVICQNTLTYAINQQTKRSKKGLDTDTYIRLKHTSRIDQNLQLVKDAIDLNQRNFNLACDSYKAMVKYNLTTDQYKEYLEKVFDSELQNHDSIVSYKHYGSLIDLYQNGVGSDLASGSVWQAYQSVTEFLSHKFGVKQNEALNTPESTAIRLNNLLFGKTAVLNKTAFLEAQKLTTVL